MSERFRETALVWNWLPAFRAVAETEHLPTAGEMMSVTPPALSRSVGNLEDALGRELFARRGRSLVLNDDGQRMLTAVRTAMRTIHDALEALAGEQFRGPFRWASAWSMSRLVVDVLAELVREHPHLQPQMLPVDFDSCAARLLRGELDLVVLTQHVDLPGLTSVELGELPHGVFCGPRHPLWGRAEVEWEELGEHAFAAPIATSWGTFEDGWPQHHPRHVSLQFAQMEVGYAACMAGHVLAVLPENVAEGLHRLRPVEAVPTAYAVHRETIAPGLAEEVVVRLRQAWSVRPVA